MRLPIRVLFWVAIALTWLPTTAFVRAAESSGGQTEKTDPSTSKSAEVEFDHAAENESRSYIRSVSPGEIIRVSIVNTCAEKFAYDLRRITREPTAKKKLESFRGVDPCPTKTKVLDIIHEEQYGGYIVSIRRTSEEPAEIPWDGGQRILKDVDLVISVPPRRWDYELAGAFTTSWLTDPAFAIEMRVPEGSTDGMEKPFVVRDRHAEDDFRLGVGAFVHVFHTQVPQLAATFGLGINEGSQTTYFTGLSWRLGDAAALTFGRAWGSVKRLPAGTRFDRPVDAGILGNLGSRTESDWFFALSYKFLKPSAGLQKPFDKVQDPGAGERESKVDASLDVPSNLTVEALCDAAGKPRVKLSWKAPRSAKSYVVLRSIDEKCIYEKELDSKNAIVGDQVSTEDQAVSPNTDYWYRVRAGDEKSESRKATECVKVSVRNCESRR